jgi:hypothetical protein
MNNKRKKYPPLNGNKLDQMVKDYFAGKIEFEKISAYLKSTNNAGLIKPLLKHIDKVFQEEYELYLDGFDCVISF